MDWLLGPSGSRLLGRAALCESGFWIITLPDIRDCCCPYPPPQPWPFSQTVEHLYLTRPPNLSQGVTVLPGPGFGLGPSRAGQREQGGAHRSAILVWGTPVTGLAWPRGRGRASEGLWRWLPLWVCWWLQRFHSPMWAVVVTPHAPPQLRPCLCSLSGSLKDIQAYFRASGARQLRMIQATPLPSSCGSLQTFSEDLRIFLRAGAPWAWVQLLGGFLSTRWATEEGGDVASEDETGCCQEEPKP